MFEIIEVDWVGGESLVARRSVLGSPFFRFESELLLGEMVDRHLEGCEVEHSVRS